MAKGSRDTSWLNQINKNNSSVNSKNKNNGKGGTNTKGNVGTPKQTNRRSQ